MSASQRAMRHARGGRAARFSGVRGFADYRQGEATKRARSAQASEKDAGALCERAKHDTFRGWRREEAANPWLMILTRQEFSCRAWERGS